MDKSITQQIPTEELQKIVNSEKLWNGYLWKDDQHKPEIFKKETIDYDTYFTTQIPFIIEGLLVNELQTISLTIKYIDGVYYCYKSMNFKDLKPVEVFIAVKVLKDKEIKSLAFIPIFKEVADPFSPDFSEYIYSHQIFKGINL